MREGFLYIYIFFTNQQLLQPGLLLLLHCMYHIVVVFVVVVGLVGWC